MKGNNASSFLELREATKIQTDLIRRRKDKKKSVVGGKNKRVGREVAVLDWSR